VIALLAVPPEKTHLNGVIAGKQIAKGLYHVDTLVEKPAPGTAPTNLSVLRPLRAAAGRSSTSSSTRPQARAARSSSPTPCRRSPNAMSLYGLETEGRLYDAGDRVGFIEATVAFALKRPEARGGAPARAPPSARRLDVRARALCHGIVAARRAWFHGGNRARLLALERDDATLALCIPTATRALGRTLPSRVRVAATRVLRDGEQVSGEPVPSVDLLDRAARRPGESHAQLRAGAQAFDVPTTSATFPGACSMALVSCAKISAICPLALATIGTPEAAYSRTFSGEK